VITSSINEIYTDQLGKGVTSSLNEISVNQLGKMEGVRWEAFFRPPHPFLQMASGEIK
jgi:hypothetical protein